MASRNAGSEKADGAWSIIVLTAASKSSMDVCRKTASGQWRPASHARSILETFMRDACARMWSNSDSAR